MAFHTRRNKEAEVNRVVRRIYPQRIFPELDALEQSFMDMDGNPLGLRRTQFESLESNGFVVIHQAIDTCILTETQKKIHAPVINECARTGLRRQRFGQWELAPRLRALKRAVDNVFPCQTVHPWFAALVSAIFYMLPLSDEDLDQRWTIKAQEYCVLNTDKVVDLPTPVAIRSHYRSYLAILHVGSSNLQGGESIYICSTTGKELERIWPEPGDLVVVDKTRIVHAVAPIKGVDPCLSAYRDIFIIEYDIEKPTNDTGTETEIQALIRALRELTNK